MHIHLDRAPLLKALQYQQGIVDRKVAIPILSHLLLKTTDDGHVEVVGTDLELTLVQKIPVIDVKEPGSITVSAHLFYDIVRKYPEDAPIVLTLDKETNLLSLMCGMSEFHVPTLPEEGYPSLDDHQAAHTFSLSGKEIKRLIDQTRFAMSGEESRFFLNGIYLHAEDNYLKAVATDAHRLALSWVPLPSGADGLKGAILSRKTVAELRKIVDSDDLVVSAEFSQTRVAFSYDNTKFFARFVNGTFPQYDKAIPQANPSTLKIDTRLFREAVDRVSVISSGDKIRGVRLHVEKGVMSLSSKGADSGSAEEEVSVDYEGTPFSISFNARYVLDAVHQIKGDVFFFHFKDAQTPVVLKDVADDKVLYVLMPVRAST